MSREVYFVESSLRSLPILDPFLHLLVMQLNVRRRRNDQDSLR